MSNTLIVYYSHSGNTRKMAKIIAEQLHADCLEIIPQKPYPQAYNAVVNQAKKDIQIDLNKYSTIFIGSPNWRSTIAPPILTFIMQNQNHLINKELIPFCTHGGGGFGHIPQDIKKLCPQSKILTGLASYDSTASNTDIHKWLTKINIL